MRARARRWMASAAIFLLLAVFSACLLPALLETAGRGAAGERVSARFVAGGERETGAVNIVTAVLLDYRGFDTLGEVTVIFAAALAVGVLLGGVRGRGRPRRALSPLVQCTIGYLGPLFWIFPVVMVLRGHLSPGGGFQGGVALAVLLILVRMAYGDEPSAPGVRLSTLASVEALMALAFVAVGTVGITAGFAFLQNLGAGFTAGRPGTLASAGFMLFLNTAIGCKVAAALAATHRHLDGAGESAP